MSALFSSSSFLPSNVVPLAFVEVILPRATAASSRPSASPHGGEKGEDDSDDCNDDPPAAPPLPLFLSSAYAKLQLQNLSFPTASCSSQLCLHFEMSETKDECDQEQRKDGNDTAALLFSCLVVLFSGRLGLVHSDDQENDDDNGDVLGSVTLRSENPLGNLMLCECRGYVVAASSSASSLSLLESGARCRRPQLTHGAGMEKWNRTTLRVAVTDATLVRVVVDPCDDDDDNDDLSNNENETGNDNWEDDPVLSCYDPTAVRQLHQWLARVLLPGSPSHYHHQYPSTPAALVGTTADAVSLFVKHEERVQKLRSVLWRRNRLLRPSSPSRSPSFAAAGHSDSASASRPSATTAAAANAQHPAWSHQDFTSQFLLVHSPHHGDGKTTLVRALLRRRRMAHLLQRQKISGSYASCSSNEAKSNRIRTMVLNVGDLLARYGVHADIALETEVHQFALETSVRKNSQAACLVLDGLEAILLPPAAGASAWSPSSTGDMAVPVLHRIAWYLKTLSFSLSPSSSSLYPPEISFPVRNRMYNAGGTRGFVLPVRFGVVGIVTCPDDAFSDSPFAASDASAINAWSSLLVSIRADRYRLPALSTGTRHLAFRRALARHHLRLDADLDHNLSRYLASSTTAGWTRGGAFDRVAKLLRAMVDTRAAEELKRKATSHEADAVHDHGDDYNDGAPCQSASSVSALDFLAALSRVGQSSSWFSGTQVEFVPNPAATAPGAERAGGPSASPSDDWFSSVGGNRRAKVAIEEALALDVVRRRRLGALGLSPPTGILLYGPPGVGKTLLAKAVSVLLRRSDAKAINAPAYVGGGMFISLNSSDLVRAEVGASEKMVMEAFENARANAPAVVFIDEFQALFVDRNTGGNSRTMTTALLECMDDVRKWSDVDIAAHLTQEGSTAVSTTDLGRRVVVLAATNTPWMIDRAFLRPGRFDRAVHVGLPTQDERASILRVHVGRMRTSFAVARPALAESFTIFCDELAAATNGFSGADLAALCRAAAVRCLLESGSNVVQERHFLEALEGDVQPSTSEEYVRRIEQWKLRGMRGGC